MIPKIQECSMREIREWIQTIQTTVIPKTDIINNESDLLSINHLYPYQLLQLWELSEFINNCLKAFCRCVLSQYTSSCNLNTSWFLFVQQTILNTLIHLYYLGRGVTVRCKSNFSPITYEKKMYSKNMQLFNINEKNSLPMVKTFWFSSPLYKLTYFSIPSTRLQFRILFMASNVSLYFV